MKSIPGSVPTMPFQSTHPRGARPSPPGARPVPSLFQSTRPRGARHHMRGDTEPCGFEFQSTRPRGARLASGARVVESSRRFNPRARVGRDSTAAACRHRSASFNPRARVGRDRCTIYRTRTNYRFNPRARVGRDRALPLALGDTVVSIHAPAWGATWRARAWPAWWTCFNPRARVGRDLISGAVMGMVRPVSIHAPAWGATCPLPSLRRARKVSIHAPAWGATRHRCTHRSCSSSFNPRARVGRDHLSGCDQRRHRNRFNPRARVGRDLVRLPDRLPIAVVSIHAPAWGATS